jgi:hypothetical protein
VGKGQREGGNDNGCCRKTRINVTAWLPTSLSLHDCPHAFRQILPIYQRNKFRVNANFVIKLSCNCHEDGIVHRYHLRRQDIEFGALEIQGQMVCANGAMICSHSRSFKYPFTKGRLNNEYRKL